MLKQTFQWGSWDITFVEWTSVQSKGGYNGYGDVAIVKPFHYTIFIDGTTYDIYFKDDNKFADFKAIARNDKKSESQGYNYAYHPGMLKQTFQWDSWDITFVEWTSVQSKGGYNGSGDVAFVEPFHYTIFINGATYDIYFQNKLFAEFKAIARNDKKESWGYNYAYHPGKIRKPECQTNGNIRTRKGVSTSDVVGAVLDVAAHAGYALAVLSLLKKK